MPWDILGLDGSSANERNVKRAYARLVKTHRPEEDPEGFKRLHQAYQQALAQVKRVKEVGPTEYPSAIDFGPPLDLTDMPSMLEEPPTPSQQTEAGPPPAKPGDDHEVVLETDRPFGHHQDCPSEQGPTVQAPKPIVAKNVKIAEVLAALEAGEETFPMRVLDKVHLTDKHGLRLKLAHAILEEPARFANDTSSRFARRLAMLMAFHHPTLTERLLDMLFQNLAPRDRDEVLADPQWLLGAAPEFKAVINKGHWNFWCAAFTDPELINWDSPLAGFALGEADRLGYWEGYEGLDHVVPKDKQLWNQRPARPTTIGRAEKNKQAENRSSVWTSFLWIFLVLIVVKGVSRLDLFEPQPDRGSFHWQSEPVIPEGWTQVGESIPVDWETLESATNLPDGVYRLPADFFERRPSTDDPEPSGE